MRPIRTIFYALILLFFFSALTRNFFEYRKNLKFYADYKTQYQGEKKRNTELKTQVLKNTDPNQVEKVIRNKLNLLKSNEIAVIIPDPTPTVYIETPTPAPNYEQWLNVFIKN